MSRPMEPVTRIDVHLLGPRGHLNARVKLPEHLVSDIPELLKGAQVLNPAVDPDAVMRTIWRLGSQQLRRNNERHVPIRLADLPHARGPKDAEASRPAQTTPADQLSGLRPSRI